MGNDGNDVAGCSTIAWIIYGNWWVVSSNDHGNNIITSCGGRQ
jgi:hypothetical protein